MNEKKHKAALKQLITWRERSLHVAILHGDVQAQIRVNSSFIAKQKELSEKLVKEPAKTLSKKKEEVKG